MRSALAEDRPFLEALYADVHGPEFAALPEGSRAQLLRSQHQIQSADYRARFPEADHSIITHAGKPIGRLLVDRSEGGINLLDISLIAAMRKQGVGTRLLQDLIGESDRSGRTITLFVVTDNPARRLYQRLGFIEDGRHGPVLAMTRSPGD